MVGLSKKINLIFKLFICIIKLFCSQIKARMHIFWGVGVELKERRLN